MTSDGRPARNPSTGKSRRRNRNDGSSNPAVEFSGAGKEFDGRWAVCDLDMEVSTGTIIGLIGPSGCGKTTAVRLANGVYAPDAGEVRLLGKRSGELSSTDRVDLGYLPQHPVLFDDLTLWGNLNFHASLNGVRFRRRRRLEELLELVELEADRDKLVSQASGGMQRRLALAATLVHEPAILMLDEPTAGIDPILRRRFWEHFRSLRDRGHTLVVTTQYVGEAADCDVVGLLTDGRLAALGAPEDLRRSASGGELLEVEADRHIPQSLLDSLANLDGVNSVELAAPARVRVVADDGGAALPVVLAEIESADLDVVDSEEVVISYDDVFIRLVDGAREEAGPETDK